MPGLLNSSSLDISYALSDNLYMLIIYLYMPITLAIELLAFETLFFFFKCLRPLFCLLNVILFSNL